MQQFILGILVGSLVTGTVVGAGTFYDSKGNVKAPAGSSQGFISPDLNANGVLDPGVDLLYKKVDGAPGGQPLVGKWALPN